MSLLLSSSYCFYLQQVLLGQREAGNKEDTRRRQPKGGIASKRSRNRAVKAQVHMSCDESASVLQNKVTVMQRLWAMVDMARGKSNAAAATVPAAGGGDAMLVPNFDYAASTGPLAADLARRQAKVDGVEVEEAVVLDDDALRFDELSDDEYDYVTATDSD